MIRLTWDLPAEAEHVRLCRRLVRTTLQHLNIGDREIAELELTIGELCSNVIRHARLSPDKTFLVELEIRDDAAEVSVTDMGIGFTPALTEEPTPTDSGGLGLWLVEQLTDRLEFQRADGDGTVVRALRRFGSSPHGTERSRERSPLETAFDV